MITLRIDKELTSYLSSKKLRLDELFVVTCFILEKMDLLRSSMTNKTPDQLTAYFQSFERKMLLNKVMPELADFDWDNYEVTERSKKIFEECSIYMLDGDPSPAIPDEEPELPKIADGYTFDQFVTDFIEKFPEGVRNAGQEYLRSNKQDVHKKMLAFFKRYPYDGVTIIAATERYLAQQAQDGYAFCSAAHYFISKLNVSKLATECDAYLGDKSGAKNGSWTQNLM